MMKEKSETNKPSNPTILVVDDEEEVFKFLEGVLSREGFRVLGAIDGHSALATLRKELADLILLDIRMPDIDGITVLKQIREISADQRVVIITAHGHIDTAKQAMELGAYDYITKPFNLDFIKEIINEALASE